MEECDIRLVHELVGGDVAAWIPQAGLEWIFLVHFTALVEHVAPLLLALRMAGDVEGRNVLGSGEMRI
jgi:hypothetical protein